MKLSRRNFCQIAGSAVAAETLLKGWNLTGQPTGGNNLLASH
jgi:hypothetical protein